MKSHHYKIAFIFLVFIFCQVCCHHVFGGNYTWNGSQDHKWSNKDNWTPAGYPTGNDSITLNIDGIKNLQLDSAKTVYRLNMQGDTLDLGTLTLTVSSTSLLSGGYITNGTLDARGASCTFSGCIINVTIAASCNSVLFNGSTFNQPVAAEITSGTTNTSNGGNIFNSTLQVSNPGLGTVIFASSTRDIFNGNVTISDTGSGTINMAAYDTSFFNGNIIVNSSGGGVTFCGSDAGFSKLARGKTISVGTKGFSTGTLLLHQFIQTGSTAQSVTLTGSSVLSIMNSKFNGTVSFTSPNILSRMTTYYEKAIFTWTGSVNNSWYGGNTYLGVSRFTNNGSGSHTMQTSVGDVFTDSITINGGSGRFYSCLADSTIFYNNLYFTGSMVSFSEGTGKAVFAGTANQLISGTTGLVFKKLTTNKTAGSLTLNTPVTISTSLNLIQGNIITDTTNLLTLTSTASCYQASNASFVSGPVKKQGNSSFTFPIGAGNSMSVAGISAPANNTDAFMAEYFEGVNMMGDSLDTLLTSISECGYWNIQKDQRHLTGVCYPWMGYPSLYELCRHQCRDRFLAE